MKQQKQWSQEQLKVENKLLNKHVKAINKNKPQDRLPSNTEQQKSEQELKQWTRIGSKKMGQLRQSLGAGQLNAQTADFEA